MALHVKTVRVSHPGGAGLLWADLQVTTKGLQVRVTKSNDELRQRERFVGLCALTLPAGLVTVPAGSEISVSERDAIEKAVLEVLS
jgi:hypothetical protein